MPKLNVIVVSTRPKRAGLPVGQWFFERAQAHGQFEVELVDLKQVALPLLDETNVPSDGPYEHEHTKAWSRSVDAADAFVFVTPEYNHFVAAPLVNALDYLYREWQYKPAAFCSYGGSSGGMRAVESAKHLLNGFSMVPIFPTVTVARVDSLINEHDVFQATPAHEKAATRVLDELLRWAVALKTMRS